MNLKRSSALLGVLAVASTLTLSACGSDNNDSTTGAAKIDVACGGKSALKASGSTAQKNAMDRFVAAYEANCSSAKLDYTASGSGAGVNEFLGGQTDFAGSDSPLDAKKGEVDKAAARCGSPAWNLPAVFGPIAVAYNVPGIDDLVLDPPTMAKIFDGEISTWDDAHIKALNTAKADKLPSDKIGVVFRSDESGTTDNFQKYLDSAGGWTKGAGKAFQGGVGEGAKGSDGTSAAIANTKFTITYTEWSFAKAQKLTTARVLTAATSNDPKPVDLTSESAAKAIDAVKVSGQGNDLVLDNSSIYKPTTGGAYPIMLATYEIVCSKYSDADTAKAVKAFLTSAVGNGQTGLADAGYVPLPDSFKTKLTTAISAIS
ncbi:MAG: Phosphate-binding protein PstS [Nocardia sp.]|uniref:phosphate ABC transporter substrate-binding protein PstS n=1 Tax=Nocardia sp. TaxID=1821 RepID=UPI002629A04F|nr:phosphate ABC transporter substrate-binding protein PstS [Nocardia sp.]MCU1646424.1 Phosphate-binding protein PstS [Nocardia sp.]